MKNLQDSEIRKAVFENTASQLTTLIVSQNPPRRNKKKEPGNISNIVDIRRFNVLRTVFDECMNARWVVFTVCDNEETVPDLYLVVLCLGMLNQLQR